MPTYLLNISCVNKVVKSGCRVGYVRIVMSNETDWKGRSTRCALHWQTTLSTIQANQSFKLAATDKNEGHTL